MELHPCNKRTTTATLAFAYDNVFPYPNPAEN